jgi:hypothetical protein
MLLAVAMLVAACTTVDGGGAADPAPTPAPAPRTPGSSDPSSAPLVLVLPAEATLHPAEHARLLVAADRALAEAAVDGSTRRVVLPRDGALRDVAAALAPEAGVLCAVGTGSADVLAAVRARRPRLVVCATPASDVAAAIAAGVLVADPEVDLAALGARLGGIARATAGARVVVVLASGDPLLGPAWSAGVVSGAEGDAIGGVRVVVGADALAAVLAGGTVGAVVLDAGPASEAALAVLARTEVPVLLPAALADAPGGPDPGRVAARFRVRWDLVLTPLLRRTRGATVVPPAAGAVVEVEPGPAAGPPADPDEVAGLPRPGPGAP